jgi:hypothetical protein
MNATTVNAKQKLIKLFPGINLYEDGAMVQNPFSGEEIQLDNVAVSCYDLVMGAQVTENWDIVRKGIAWFRQYYPKEYMVLLD